DVTGSAAMIADLLAVEVKRAVVSVFRADPRTGEVVLIGCSSTDGRGAPIGSRVVSDRGVLDAALEQGSIQRSLNHYVEPDFVRSLPGETRSALAVPVRVGGRALGIIHLEYSSPFTPDTRDEVAVARIAEYLGVA